MVRRLALLASLFVFSTAHALTQPSGAQIPAAPGCSNGQPNGLAAIFACACTQPNVCNIGGPCASQTSCDNGQHGTCETTLWHNFNDNTCLPSNLSGLDPAKDASLTPATFHPSCALTFTVLSRGTARFQNAFGWYNVTGAPPQPSDMHLMLDCNAKPGASVVLDVKSDPSYKGGDVGFFLVTPEDNAHGGQCANGDCCATVARATTGQGRVYYSERQFNPDGSGANPYIHLLVYDSTLQKQKFYFAWEDTFDTTSANFTDLVTSVDGVQCGGAGQPCDTGQKGMCANGISDCSNGVLGCMPLTGPSPEQCDGLDNDCDGQIDNGATCPDPGDICQNGQCVSHCSSSAEFSCPAQLSCDDATGLCIDPACRGVTCPDGKVCHAGACTGPCDGITCPHGTTCKAGACIDACAKVSCAAGQVCLDGICLAACNQCGGISCSGGLACDVTSGGCADPSCATPCPVGSYCDQGTCKDSCAGATCPLGQACSGGECVMQLGGPDGGAGAGAGGAGGNAGNGTSPDWMPTGGGCSCDPMAHGSSSPMKSASLFAFVLLALFVRQRRR